METIRLIMGIIGFATICFVFEFLIYVVYKKLVKEQSNENKTDN